MTSSTFQDFLRGLTPDDRELLTQLADKLTHISATRRQSDSHVLHDWEKYLHQAMPTLTTHESQALAYVLVEVELEIAKKNVTSAAAHTGSANPSSAQRHETQQQESRQYAIVANIMKTKHDTVKNTISNVH